MELRQIMLSGTVRFVTAKAEGAVFAPDLVEAIKDRYRFWEYPTKPAEFNLESGVTFNHGTFDGEVLVKMQLFHRGVLVQATASTAKLDAFVDDLLRWGGDRFSVTYETDGPVSKSFNSSLEVNMSPTFAAKLGDLERVASALTETVRARGITGSNYKFGGLSLLSDPLTTIGIKPGRFLIERRVGHVFEEQVFYSEAPVSTEEHLRLLEVLEGSL